MPLNEFQKAFLKNILVPKTSVIDPDTGEPVDWDALGGEGGEVTAEAVAAALADLGMVDAGDILIVGGGFTNELTTAKGASVSSPSGDWQGTPSLVMDGDPDSVWRSTATPPNGLLLADLGSAKLISRILIRQLNDANSDHATSLNVQTSANNSDWTTLESFVTLAAGYSLLTLTTPTSSRYWRLDGTGGGAQGWGVQVWELQSADPVTITKLSTAGANIGDVLTINSDGMPAWE